MIEDITQEFCEKVADGSLSNQAIREFAKKIMTDGENAVRDLLDDMFAYTFTIGGPIIYQTPIEEFQTPTGEKIKAFVDEPVLITNEYSTPDEKKIKRICDAISLIEECTKVSCTFTAVHEEKRKYSPILLGYFKNSAKVLDNFLEHCFRCKSRETRSIVRYYFDLGDKVYQKGSGMMEVDTLWDELQKIKDKDGNKAVKCKKNAFGKMFRNVEDERK